MRVGVYTNLRKDVDLSVTRTLLNCLENSGVEYLLDSALMEVFSGKKYFSAPEPTKMDFMITVGGDGTILRIAGYCAKNGIPIAGLNLGHVGFLTESEKGNAAELVAALKSKQYRLENRTLLCAETSGNESIALNDAVVVRDFDERMLETDVFVNGEFVDSFFCDGFIVSTPTGSTAYSLSAGGPILSPRAAAFALTSINSHSLHSRPIVVSDSDRITLALKNSTKARLVIDGEPVVELGIGSVIEVKKSDLALSFVRLGEHDFFNKLLTKLNKWSTTEKEIE